MANNTIGWGQGATNNNIGWGRGSSNDIGWGSVYTESYVGDTDIQGADARFIITVKTDNAGTSASNQFTLPWIGTYDVEWGDGNSDVGVSGTQTHTYASAGTYDVAVTAASGRIFFDNGGDKLKLLDIKNWGAVEWTSMYNSFYGCDNLTIITSTDSPNLNLSSAVGRMFGVCRNLSYIDVSDWNLSNITGPQDMLSMFYLCQKLTTLDVSNWDTSLITRMDFMFYDCLLLKADLSGLDIASVTNFSNFATGTNINETGTTTNYDNTLISWAAQAPQNNIVINFGGSKYSNAAAAARELLTRAVVDGGYGWTITDGGGVDLLDTYTGAAAAYSLRTIKSSTTKVVRVRADVVGQPEQDFTAAQITDGTLATFVGAGNNGYVVTWYDQSGNGNHATQGTDSNQPQIVASGVVNLVNGMPAILSDGVDDYLTVALSATNPTTQFFVYDKVGTSGSLGGLFDSGISYASGLVLGATGVYAYQQGPQFTPTYANNNQSVVSLKSSTTGTDWAMWGNGTSITNSGENIGTTAPAKIVFFSQGGIVSYGNSYLQEYIVYPSDQTSNQSAIESNINDYYNIY